MFRISQPFWFSFGIPRQICRYPSRSFASLAQIKVPLSSRTFITSTGCTRINFPQPNHFLFRHSTLILSSAQRPSSLSTCRFSTSNFNDQNSDLKANDELAISPSSSEDNEADGGDSVEEESSGVLENDPLQKHIPLKKVKRFIELGLIKDLAYGVKRGFNISNPTPIQVCIQKRNHTQFMRLFWLLTRVAVLEPCHSQVVE